MRQRWTNNRKITKRAKRYDRNAPQEIRIYYRDIGLIDEMPETMTAEKEKPTQTEVTKECGAVPTDTAPQGNKSLFNSTVQKVSL